MFPSGSSSTSNSPEQCTTVVITNDRTPEDDDYFNLLASSSDPSVFFTPGRKNVSVLIQDDDSKHMCNRKQKKLIPKNYLVMACHTLIIEKVKKQGEMPLPILSSIPFIKCRIKDGMGLRIGNGTSPCPLAFQEVEYGRLSLTPFYFFEKIFAFLFVRFF